MSVKAVLFDLNDTLFDNRHSARSSLTSLRARFLGLASVEFDELERVNLNILNEVHQSVLGGALTIGAARLKRFGLLFNFFSVALNAEELRDASNLYREQYQASRRPTKGALELLRGLRARDVRIGVVTNNLVEEQIDKLQYCGLTPVIDSTTISEEAGVAKPNPRIFEIALDRLNCSASEAVMIGDSWVNDILGARSAGIRAIWYNCYHEPPPEPGVEEILSLEDHQSVLELILQK